MPTRQEANYVPTDSVDTVDGTPLAASAMFSTEKALLAADVAGMHRGLCCRSLESRDSAVLNSDIGVLRYSAARTDRTCSMVLIPPAAFTPTESGTAARRYEIVDGSAMPTAPLDAFFTNATPASIAACTARSR